MKYIKPFLAMAILIVFDQITKYLAIVFLKGIDAFPVIRNVFEFVYVENRGAAFGMMQNSTILFLVIGIVVLLVIAFFYIKMPKTKKFNVLRAILIVIASGAVGNMIDRIARHYVVDFIYFKPIDFPVFNVADIYVSLGAIALVIYVLFFLKDDDISLKKKGKKTEGGQDEQ